MARTLGQGGELPPARHPVVRLPVRRTLGHLLILGAPLYLLLCEVVGGQGWSRLVALVFALGWASVARHIRGDDVARDRRNAAYASAPAPHVAEPFALDDTQELEAVDG